MSASSRFEASLEATSLKTQQLAIPLPLIGANQLPSQPAA